MYRLKVFDFENKLVLSLTGDNIVSLKNKGREKIMEMWDDNAWAGSTIHYTITGSKSGNEVMCEYAEDLD